MENINFNDAINNVKTIISPNKKNNNLLSNNTIIENKNDNIDFSFKKNFNNENNKEQKININQENNDEKNQTNDFSKNIENIFSSGSFGTQKNKSMVNDENFNISNFSIFKESNKSKFSSFDNYIYSSSKVDDMDFSYSNNNSKNKIIEISPFFLPLFNNNNEDKDKEKIDINMNKNEYNNKINNSSNILKKNPLNHKRSYIQNSIKEYNINKKNKLNDFIKFIEIKYKNKKSSNKYIILNNSILQKKLDLLSKQFGEISLNKKNNNIIQIEEDYQRNNNNHHNQSFPNNNNYISIRKVFGDISNNQIKENKNNNFKAKLPKNFEIHKRKLNIIKFEELIQKEKNKSMHIKKKIGGCCCKQYKNNNLF